MDNIKTFVPEVLDDESKEIVNKPEFNDEVAIINDNYQDVETEIDEAIEKLKKIRDAGLKGIDFAYGIMEGTEHPRSVEVFSNLLRDVADITEKAVNIQKLRKELKEPSKIEPNQTKSTNTTIYVGSTEDLRKMLSEDQ